MNVTSFVLMVGLAALACAMAQATVPKRDELASARRWLRNHTLTDEGSLPFSFTYGGQPAETVLRATKSTLKREKLDAQRTRFVKTWRLPDGLEVRCEAVSYADYPAVEWTLWFKNTAARDTAILSDILAANFDITGSTEDPTLHHNVGSPSSKSDYAPLTTPLPIGASKRITAAGGRPTNSDMSYFNLEWGTEGLIIAVGWPGQWAAEFSRTGATTVRLRAGQELTHFKLLPGEEVRSPLMVLLWWKAGRGEDWLRGQNLWRRWMMAHSMPKPGGKLPPPQLVASSSRAYEEMIHANEENQIWHIDRYVQLGLKLDYWWMDAGWYVQQNGWPQTGTWEVDRARFPHGFRRISDHAHSKGIKILVWFEPERVAPGTWLAENRPEWLLSASPAQARQMSQLLVWRTSQSTDPCVTYNPGDEPVKMANIVWEPGSLAFHPGPKGEYAVVRWTAPADGEYHVTAEFKAIDQQTSTDVHVLKQGLSVFDGLIGVNGAPRTAQYEATLQLGQGDTLDFVVGWGNGSHVCDSTRLAVRILGPDGRLYDAAQDFSHEQNPAGRWSYGYLPPSEVPVSGDFRLFDTRTRASESGNRLLYLGNPEAWRWLVEHIDRLITENGIDLYRQDFNFDPLPYWRANDAPDRQGITEIKHVMGYLAFWDELRRRHPSMLIDSCASGGRRNDLETMRRSVPLWRSDYAYEAVGHQCMTYGISLWLPYHGTATVATDHAPYYGGGRTPIQPYAFWSNTAPSLGLGIDVREELDYDALRKLVAAWRELSRYYTGDFYPLTPYSQETSVWMAWQFHVPESGEGAVQAFRRQDCPDDALSVRLRGIDRRSRYVIRDLDTGSEWTVSGRTLVEDGLRVECKDRPAAVNLVYRRMTN